MYSEAGRLIVRETAFPVLAGSGCAGIGGGRVDCGLYATSIELNLGGGDDWAGVTTSLPVIFRGGQGHDRYLGGMPSLGNTEYEYAAKVTFEGGPGIDMADYRYATMRVAVDLDGAADDGRLGRDSDRIMTDVEQLIGSDFDDSLRGGPNADYLEGRLGSDSMRGGGGDDIIDARVSIPSATDVDTDLSCGTGLDLIKLGALDPNPVACETIER